MILKTILFLCIAGFVAALQNNKNGGSVLDCNFDYGEYFCRWNIDPRDQTAVWESMNYGSIIGDAACMRPVISKLRVMKKHSARLWSSWLNLDTGKKNGFCLKFLYKIEMEEGNESELLPSLALLKHSEGSCRQQASGTSSELKCTSDIVWSSKSDDIHSKNDLMSAARERVGSSLSSKWQEATLTLLNGGDFKLILEGTIPSGNPNAKICVDNITSSAEPCPTLVSEEVKAAQSYQSWVELFGMTFAGALALGLTIPIAVFVVCIFERKRRRGKKNKRIIRHADELDLPEGMNTASGEDTYPIPQKYANSQVGIGHPRLMNRANSTPAGANGQGGNYTMGKRNGTPQQALGPRSTSGQISHTMGRSGLESGWMMSSQHGDLMENDEYTIDSDYTTHRQMSVPATGYVPVSSQVDTGLMQGQVSSMNAMQQLGNQSAMYQNRQVPQPQANVVVATTASNNPFGSPANIGMSGAGQDNRSLAGSHVVNFTADENRATPGLPFYPPRYEEAMGFNHGQPVTMEEKPPLLPPRVPESSGSGAGTSCSTPLPPAPPPLPLSGHPSAGRFNVGGHNVLPGNEL